MDVFSNCSNVISDALERRRSAGVVVLAEFLKVTALAGVEMPLPRSDRERGMDNLGLRDRRGCWVSLWVSSRGGVVMAVVADPLIILCYMLNAAEKAQGILTMNKQPTGSTLQTTVVVLLL